MVIKTMAGVWDPIGPINHRTYFEDFQYKIIVLDKTQQDATCPNISFAPHDAFQS